MKKIAIILLIILSTSSLLFAYKDSFNDYNDNSDWKSLFEAIKEDRGKTEVESLYNKYVSSDISNIEKARCEYNYIRYLVDSGEIDEAKKHLQIEKEIVENLEESDDFFAKYSKVEYSSSQYYVSKELFHGLESSNKTKELYKEYPDEISVIILNAWRLIYTPQIAGGSNKNAIKILLPLLDSLDIISTEDRYSLYGALATAYYNRRDYVTAKEYLNLTLEIFSGEKTILELKEKLDKK